MGYYPWALATSRKPKKGDWTQVRLRLGPTLLVLNKKPKQKRRQCQAFFSFFVLGLSKGEIWRAELREAAENVANVASQGDSGHPLGPPLPKTSPQWRGYAH
jgi:hypothetical protein